jgi:hypothetical protein
MVVVTLKGISAIQTIISNYAPRKNLLALDSVQNESLPQTLISTEIEDVDEIPVTALLHEKSKRSYYFLDNRKIQNKFWRNLIDITSSGPLPHSTNKPCWWCRSSFTNNPVGCPLKYNIHKSGDSGASVNEKFKNAGIKTKTNDFFETEGIFCSFPCCKAYILDQRGIAKYHESLALLSLLLAKIYGNMETIEIPIAPSWKILKDYGGHLTIEEFRATFGKIEYTPTVNMRRPYMFCSSQLLEEQKIKLFKKVK